MTDRSARDDIWAPQPGGQPRPGRQPHRGRQRRRPRRRWPAIAGYTGVALISLCLAAVAFALVAPPLDAVRERLIQQVHARTGRTLTVAGPLSVSLYPRVVVSLGGVAMPPPEGMEGAPTLTVASIDAEMSLWSLLSRRPRLDRLTLNQPTIDLVVDAQGRRSWDRARDEPPRQAPTRAAPAATAAAAPAAAKPKAARRTRRPRPIAVRVVDGTVRYRDERSGARYEVGQLGVDVAANGPERASELSGSFVWQGAPFRFAGSVAPPARTRDQQPAQVVLKLAGAPLEATYKGTLSLQGRPSAEGTVSLAHLVYKDLRIGSGTLGISVNAGVGKVTLRDVELYGGRGDGSLTFDTTGATPAISTSLKLTGISVLPLLKDAAGVAWLDGRGAVTLALDGQGSSQQQIVETLKGQVQVSVAEGAVTGIDIGKALREIRRGRLGNLAPRREDRTPFSALTATFDIANGVAKNQDLKLVSAHVQLTGEGQIELAPARIDYTLHTKIEGGAPDDKAVVNFGTLEVPVRIAGPLDRPEFTIKGQEELTDAIKRIGKNLRSREVQDAIEGLLGGDRDKQVDPGDLIEKLLK